MTNQKKIDSMKEEDDSDGIEDLAENDSATDGDDDDDFGTAGDCSSGRNRFDGV